MKRGKFYTVYIKKVFLIVEFVIPNLVFCNYLSETLKEPLIYLRNINDLQNKLPRVVPLKLFIEADEMFK